MLTNIPLPLTAWTAFRTPNFSIEPALAGLHHRFPFEGRTITLYLPSAPTEAPEGCRETIWLSGWRKENELKVPLQFSVSEVALAVSVDQVLDLPEEIVHRRPNASDVLSQFQQGALDEISRGALATATRGFDRWARTMRWKTDRWSLARPEADDEHSGWGCTLKHAETGGRIWVHHPHVVLHLPSTTTQTHWDEAALSLA